MAKISSNFGHIKSVAKGVTVRYTLSDYPKGTHHDPAAPGLDSDSAPEEPWRWYIAYNFPDNNGKDPEFWKGTKDDAGNSINRMYFVWKWNKAGRHQVRCAALKSHTYVKFDQQVEELEAILETQMKAAKEEKLTYPYAELTVTWKWLAILDGIGKTLPMSATAKKEHDKRIAELENYAERLKALLAQCDEEHIYPFRAVYLAKESMEEKELRVFLTRPRGKKDRLMIVDWTNLNEPKLHGTYEGKFPPWKGRTTAKMLQAAFKNAVETWGEDNHYWPGGIRYELNAPVGGADLAGNGTIKTGDTSWTVTLVEVLKKIAEGAAVIGLVLTGVGSVYAGALIVTSMVAGGTASVLSIHHRHSRGESNFIEDATDVLDVVGNVFGLGYRAGKKVIWRAGAEVQNLRIGQKVVNALFIGEVFTDGFNGVLLGMNFVSEYDKIMNAQGMLPEQRAQALLDLFGKAAQSGLIVGINHKVAESIEKAEWTKLMDRSKPLDLRESSTFRGEKPQGGQQSTNQPKTKGSSSDTTTFKGDNQDGGKQVKVSNKQKGDESKGKKPGDKESEFADEEDTVVDPPRFDGDTKDGKKKVTTVTSQQRHPPATVAPAKTKRPDDWPSENPSIWDTHLITDKKINLQTKDGFYFRANIDQNGYVTIDVNTKMNGKHSPHLGTGRQNYDRMFRHFEASGHPIKGWWGMLTQDNYVTLKKAMKDKHLTLEQAVQEGSVSGKEFWKPWADAKGYRMVDEGVVDHDTFVTFMVRFEAK